MIEYHKIEPETVEVRHDINGFSAVVNEYEFNDLRIQIKEKGEEGYYLIFDGARHYINKHGKVHNWPVNLFRLFEDQLYTLI